MSWIHFIYPTYNISFSSILLPSFARSNMATLECKHASNKQQNQTAERKIPRLQTQTFKYDKNFQQSWVLFPDSVIFAAYCNMIFLWSQTMIVWWTLVVCRYSSDTNRERRESEKVTNSVFDHSIIMHGTTMFAFLCLFVTLPRDWMPSLPKGTGSQIPLLGLHTANISIMCKKFYSGLLSKKTRTLLRPLSFIASTQGY